MRSLRLYIFAAFLIITALTVHIRNTTAAENETSEFIGRINIENITFTTPEFNTKKDMVASWYGPNFHGRNTANGEVYDQMGLTAAHKNLPFGTVLRLTNPKNDKTVLVRINDRGPYFEGRQIDLSLGAAEALGMVNKGVVKLKVEEMVYNFSQAPALPLN